MDNTHNRVVFVLLYSKGYLTSFRMKRERLFRNVSITYAKSVLTYVYVRFYDVVDDLF